MIDGLSPQHVPATSADGRRRAQLGNLRVDVNVSTRRLADGVHSNRCEVKNLNSFERVRKAVEFEARRQQQVLEGGGSVPSQTRTFDVASGRTVLLRYVRHGTREIQAKCSTHVPHRSLPA